MRAKTSNELVPARKSISARAGCLLAWVFALAALFGLLAGASRGFGQTTLTEHQVKALFLLNFAKYVEWPANAFADASAPMVIGVISEGKFQDELARAVAGKSASGRRIILQPVANDGDLEKCHILFISDSEKKRLGEILGKIKARPVLTVGETDQFMEHGGVINFVKKEGKVRLEINLEAARQAKLQISSKLLNVADEVKGKLK